MSEAKESVCRWPDNWSNTGLQWAIDWIQAHAAHAMILGKPLILQEWGVHLGQSPPQPQHHSPHSFSVAILPGHCQAPCCLYMHEMVVRQKMRLQAATLTRVTGRLLSPSCIHTRPCTRPCREALTGVAC